MTTALTHAQIIQQIEAELGREVLPEELVEIAKPSDHPLHDSFDWNNASAGHKYRVHQARQILRVAVTVLPGDDEPVRAFVSLKTDRYSGGGYRSIKKVLGTKKFREQMLQDALDELETFERKYARLTELAGVFTAAKKVRKSKTK